MNKYFYLMPLGNGKVTGKLQLDRVPFEVMSALKRSVRIARKKCFELFFEARVKDFKRKLLGCFMRRVSKSNGKSAKVHGKDQTNP